MVRMRHWLVRGLVWIGVITLLAGMAGAWHGIGDSLSLLRAPVIAATAGLLLFTGPWIWRWGVLALLVGLALPIAIGKRASPAPGPFVIYQKNLLFANQTAPLVAADILAVGPDVVTLQEVSGGNASLLKSLSGDYPYQHLCPYRGWNGVAVLSRLPMVPGTATCNTAGGFAAAQILTVDGPLWIVSLHLHWPFPYRQADHVAALLPALEGLEGPVLIGGDFNMVPWGHTVRKIAETTQTTRAGRLFPTLRRNHIPFVIDHILAPGGGAIERRALLGSDHHGIVGRVTLSGAE